VATIRTLGAEQTLHAVERDVGEQGRDHALNTKGNFCFERSIQGWRSHSVLDLRRKR
jgi:hypothetical protein